MHRGPRPVTAVIYTHSHVDHYGGVRGVLDEADVCAGRVDVIAPARFMEEVVSENVLAGSAMMRRAQFQFGATLPKGPRGQVDAGLGKVTSRGTVTLIPPTRIVEAPFETHRIDGVEIIFQLAPETEAPAEMHMFYPALRALNLAENATHNLHNVGLFQQPAVDGRLVWWKGGLGSQSPRSRSGAGTSRDAHERGRTCQLAADRNTSSHSRRARPVSTWTVGGWRT
jgi:alkyl sulfatase BDS1-like metallo-beta-lactamase superfamily hydrolase